MTIDQFGISGDPWKREKQIKILKKMPLSAESKISLSLSLLKIASVRSRTTQLQKIGILVCYPNVESSLTGF